MFLIQNTQNRESKAMQLKLDELIRCMDGAHNALLNLEDLSTDEIAHVQKHYVNIARTARLDLKQGKSDTGIPEAHIHKAANSSVLRDIRPLHQIGAEELVAENVIEMVPSIAGQQVIKD